jgi:RNA polymerase subunit RPABC4/transcription elongation factor Spt4
LRLAFTLQGGEFKNPMPPEDSHLSERSEKAAKIIAQPGSFKVCESCDSIVAKRVALCPNCNGYRFDTDPARVVAQAKELATRAQTTVTHEDLE